MEEHFLPTLNARPREGAQLKGYETAIRQMDFFPWGSLFGGPYSKVLLGFPLFIETATSRLL